MKAGKIPENNNCVAILEAQREFIANVYKTAVVAWIPAIPYPESSGRLNLCCHKGQSFRV
jgi:hypothetical protein